jgi:phage/plasmid-associated DNA primase
MEDGSLVPLFKVWNSNVNRFEVARVVYAPGLGPLDATGLSILNLYQGLAKRPAAGTWTLMRRHLLHVICRGELKHYLFLLAWMAHLVQKPAEAPGVVVVLRSLMEGAGKTTVVEWLCSIMGRHALMLNDPTQLLTKFNAHLEDKSFIGVNEPSWPGNKDAEAKLKSMITDPFLTIERKHGGVYTVPNNLHFMFTTNAEWAVPAGAGARRYLVLDVDASKAGNHNYFKALRNEVENGGLEAFLHVLQSFRLDLFDLRSIPITDALRDQQERSLSLEAQWAIDLADREGGSNLGISQMFGRQVSTRELYDDYTSYAAARRRYPVSSETFGKYLSRIGVPLHRTGNSRYRVMPTADDFEALVKAGAGVHQ